MMAGKRMLHANICQSKKLSEISFEAETLYYRMLTQADDDGNFTADPRVVLGLCAPLRKEWNDEKVKVLVLNIDAGGVGINLTRASIVMFADMDWFPGIHEQAEDRAHRIGQKGTVNVYYYVCPKTIEEDIIRLLNSKKGVVDQILEGKKRRVAKASVGAEFLKIIGGVHN